MPALFDRPGGYHVVNTMLCPIRKPFICDNDYETPPRAEGFEPNTGDNRVPSSGVFPVLSSHAFVPPRARSAWLCVSVLAVAAIIDI